MAELLPPAAGPITTGPPPQPPPTTTTAAATATAIASSTDNLAPKRQRRPSVRLGEIGDQPATLSYESNIRRNKLWRLPKDTSKSSKTRPLTNLVNNGDCNETLDTEDVNFSGDVNHHTNLDFANRKIKDPRGKRASIKRVRSNWISKPDDLGENEEKFSSKEDGDDGFREFEAEGSDSQLLKDQSPVHSVDNAAPDLWQTYRRPVRARVSQSRDHDGIELDGMMMPESNSRDQKCETSDGVRNWLIGLGLGRYAPVFEIHEVDDEVLPLLTLEDLKDMGINAVGSRRKMYSAIQKLRKSFS